MIIQDLIADLPLCVVKGDANVAVDDLCDDSRCVDNQGRCLFVARSGANQNGRSFIADAIRHGAAAVLSDRGPDMNTGASRSDLVWIVGEKIDQAVAGQLAERFFAHPSQELKLIGVTGTNGKTTTSLMAAHLLKQTGPCGVVGTVFVDDGRQKCSAQLTTPGAIELSRRLATMVKNRCWVAVLEVSSHALAQHRTDAIEFDTAIFTNLTGDHLDYHPTMQHYAAAKSRLFDQLAPNSWAVVNADDDYAPQVVARCRGQRLRCTTADPPESDCPCRAEIIHLGADHCLAAFVGPWGRVQLRLPMPGAHNIANALHALVAVDSVRPLTAEVCQSLEHLPPVPGRLEPIRIGNSAGPAVLVDYAHTHDALENVLVALRPVTEGRLIVLFGCGGDRDAIKRPKMASVACRLADEVIITSDNPRTEDPMSIIEDILEGVPRAMVRRTQVEPDRGKAIELAVAKARVEDTVILAGKGHEPYQEIGNQRIHFDDREHATEALGLRLGERLCEG